MSSSRSSRRDEFFALVDAVGDLPSSGLATSGLVEVSSTARRAAELLVGGVQMSRERDRVGRLAYELGQLESAERAVQVSTPRPGSAAQAVRGG